MSVFFHLCKGYLPCGTHTTLGQTPQYTEGKPAYCFFVGGYCTFFSISTANRAYFSNYLNSIFYNGEYRVQVAYDIANEFNILSKLPKAIPFIAIFKRHLLGWGSWTRTSEYRSQSPVPYRLGDTPILVGTWGFEPETDRL